jgi:hypothetical protein
MRAGRRALPPFDGVMFRNHYFFRSAQLSIAPEGAAALILRNYNLSETQGKDDVFWRWADIIPTNDPFKRGFTTGFVVNPLQRRRMCKLLPRI